MSTAAANRTAARRHVAGQDPYRWVMLGLIWLLYASFGLVRAAPAPLVEPIVRDLRLTYTQMGTVLGAWPLVYIAVAYFAGTLLDRIGLRRALIIGGLVIALSGLLRAFAGDFATMFLAVAIFGIGGPTVSVGAPKLIAVWFSGRDRATAAGVYTTGSVLGQVGALSTANAVLLPLTGSWRSALAIYGAVALAAAALWRIFARDPPLPAAGAASSHSASDGLRRLLRVRNVWLVLAMGFVALVTNHGLTNWLPMLLQRGGMTAAEAGYWASVPQIAGVVAVLFLPRLTPQGRRRPMIAGLLAIAAVSTVVLATASGLALTVALLLQGISRTTLTPLLMLALIETPEVGPEQMGAAGGLYFTVGEMGGFAGPFLLGLLFDLTGTFWAGLLVLTALNVALIFATPFLRESATAAP